MILQAAGYGLLSASGLLLGSIASMVSKPSRKFTAIIMAFGSGTLIAAVAFDLCIEAYERGGTHAVVPGFLFGGIIFVGAGHVVDNFGGFMRKYATKHRFLHQKKIKRASEILDELSRVDILHALPPDEVQSIIPFAEKKMVSAGDVIFRQGDEGDALYLVRSGKINITGEGSQKPIAVLSEGETFGEIAILTKESRTATAVCAADSEIYRIKQDDFQRLMAHSPKLSQSVSALLAQRLENPETKKVIAESAARKWHEKALQSIQRSKMTAHEESLLMEEHAPGNAPLAIFLGALIDGIPESVVIGASLTAGAGIGFSFLAAVFLSNFPEAMSSSVGMKESGFSNRKVLTLWALLTAASGLASLLGNVFFAHAPEHVIALIQALAAGGILAMLANTMMPEAFELGGPPIAFATITGFLTAFLIGKL